MANLNFQQPPRSIANSGLGGSGRVGGGFGSVSTGHVTPTFGTSTTDKIGTLSPGRSNGTSSSQTQTQINNRNSLFGQRTYSNERRIPPASNAMASVGALSRYSGYHSVFGGDGDSSTPPLLDLSEFPSLTGARGAGVGAAAAAAGAGDHAAPQPPGTKPYVGMVKAPATEASEFQMSSEDFPALPGTHSNASAPQSSTPALNNSTASDGKRKPGIQTSIDGTVTNIPATMVPNQFGIVGLLTFIRAAESDPSLVSLALGQDLTALGLNLNSPDNLYLTFAGPWADMPCRPQDMDYHVPPEYLINYSIRDKLAPLRLSRYKEDLLFYLFYCFVGDVLQIAAATELYNREWRYHTEEKVWISQAPGMPMLEKTSTYERGTYYFFDAHNWRKVAKEFHLDYAKLEGRPQLPAH